MAPASRQTAVVIAPAGTAGAAPAGTGGGMLATVRTLIGNQVWLFVALAAWAVGPLLVVALHVLVNGGVMTGANGGDFIDQFQYLAWIRDAGSHGLASNLWVIGHTPHDYLHPMYFISGLLWRLGLGLQLAYLIWKPIALLVLFLGCAWYVARLEPESRPRRTAALALALFYQSPAYAVAVWTGHLTFAHRLALLLVSDDATASLQLWGFEHTAIAIGAMAIFLICAERLLSGPAPRRWVVGAAVAGLSLAWLHPWQAGTALVVLGSLFVLRGPRRRFAVLAIPVAATVAPLIYGLALSHYDTWWHTFKVDSQITGTAPWWALALSLGPLFALAAVGLRRPASDREWILVLWVAATVAVYFLVPEFPPHALAGLTVPLAVLSVRGLQAIRERLRLSRHVTVALGTLAIAVVTAPALYNHAQGVSQDLSRKVLGAFALPQLRLTDDEHSAMVYLEHAPGPGGVLAPPNLSLSVPAFSGRRVFAGHLQWEPAINNDLADAFFGRASGVLRRSILLRSQARFVLAPCDSPAELRAQLAPLRVHPVWRRGCVTVFEAGAT